MYIALFMWPISFNPLGKYLIFSGVSLVFLLLSLITEGAADFWVLVILVAVTGIPHGAIDHVIYAQQRRLANPKASINWWYFFASYLALLAVAATAWVFLPVLMFLLFMLISAYHFGQSQLYHFPLAEHVPQKQALYMSWGMCLLGLLLLTHWPQQAELLATLFSWDMQAGGLYHTIATYITVVAGAFWLVHSAYLGYKKLVSWKAITIEVAVILFLYLVFINSSLYLSFALYFGLWHATRVIFTEYNYLHRGHTNGFSKGDFFKAFIPFSLISFAGLAILWFASSWLSSAIAPFLLFLIFISALTLPHALLMHGMYAFFAPNKPDKLFKQVG